MWFWLSLIALLCWSGSDLFSKIGCRDADDHLAHLKMVIAVGVVMGLHAAYEIFIGGVSVTWHVIWTYLPVSLLYIVSMALGYVGLRYIELSISSPICNASGAVVAVLYLCFGGLDEDLSGGMRVMVLLASALVCGGVIGLGVVESREDDELRRARQAASNYRYAKSWLALALPVAYCLLDAAGTFADSRVLTRLDPDAANCAYELTFLFAAVVSFVYVKFIRHDRFLPKREGPKYVGALFETAGQFAYIYAIADEDHVMYAAPIISAYCAASVLWSRIFQREKLSWRHYMMLVLIVAGIVLLGISYVVLYMTRFGLRLRACGEHPQAADSVGINVYKMRYAGTTISGALAGMGGFVYALTTANCASNGDVAGFGFLALAVMIFGNWKPVNIAVSSLLFGLFKCIAASYASIDINGDGVYMLAESGSSAHLYRMLPYIVTLLVLAFTSKSSRAPKAEGIPYDKGQR